MKSLNVLIVLIFILASLNTLAQQNIGIERYPEIPIEDSLKAWSNQYSELLTKKGEKDKSGKRIDTFFLGKKPFTGWVFHIFPKADSLRRYIKLNNGLVERQIGYYANGQLEEDFNNVDGYSVGSQQMWYPDGKPFIDNYYSRRDVMDGLQLRWYPNGQLAQRRMFKNGVLVVEERFDQSGKEILMD